jgi:hypothetical protein
MYFSAFWYIITPTLNGWPARALLRRAGLEGCYMWLLIDGYELLGHKGRIETYITIDKSACV